MAVIRIEKEKVFQRNILTQLQNYLFSAYHKNFGTKAVPAYSDYRALKLREKYRRRQMNFVEGKFPGIKLSIINFEPSKDFK